jgi:hypothetical protein
MMDVTNAFARASRKHAMANDPDAAVRSHLIELLRGGQAHLTFDEAIKDIPVAVRGKRPPRAAHSPWELLEHLRIAQWDILEFSRNPKHASPDWPEGYWPASPKPPTRNAWKQSADAFRADLEAMIGLVTNPKSDLYAKIPHGTGQTLLREVLLAADHNSYHYGQLTTVKHQLLESTR